MQYIRTIDTNQDIPSGSIIVFNSQPETKWIIQYGVYVYGGQPATGWHAKDLPTGAILPINPSEFKGVTLISGGFTPGPCPCPPKPGPCPPKPGPCPPGPCPPGPRPEPYWTEAPNMITVQSIEERDRISHCLLVDGKVVRVNNYNGKPEYFEWDDESRTWRFATWGSQVYTSDEVDDKFSTKEETKEVIQAVITWNKLGE